MTSLITMIRRKKSILYLLCSGALLYYVIQVVYFTQEFSPLQVLSDARSEARRLLRFITLYHYQCNATLQMSNTTHWPICTEIEAGINVESKSLKRAYSVGPSDDFEFERLLVKNFSFYLYFMCHKPLPFLNNEPMNNTFMIKTIVVPNNPTDFTRNSYETQTLNDIMLNLRHEHLDILKIEHVMDEINTHEILFYLVKDDILRKVDQLHIALHIDKVDDDYLYSWYRSLYNLFHLSRFRLYHTSASDQLCLQITLMESCTYYMSWIRDPGPQTMILYPPAIDGKADFELARLEDYLERPDGYCDTAIEMTISGGLPVPICTHSDKYTLEPPCKLIYVSENSLMRNKDSYLQGQVKCGIIGLKMLEKNIDSDVEEYSVDKTGILSHSTSMPSSLMETLDRYMTESNVIVLYLDIPDIFWEIITPLLNSGVFKDIHQLVIDISLQRISKRLPSGIIRTYYSELMRIESFGFDLYDSVSIGDVLKQGQHNRFHRLNYVKARPSLGRNV